MAIRTKQRKRKNMPDIGELDYKNTSLLQQFIDSTGKILGRRQTGLDAKKQRAVQRAIKQARSLGTMPFKV